MIDGTVLIVVVGGLGLLDILLEVLVLPVSVHLCEVVLADVIESCLGQLAMIFILLLLERVPLVGHVDVLVSGTLDRAPEHCWLVNHRLVT